MCAGRNVLRGPDQPGGRRGGGVPFHAPIPVATSRQGCRRARRWRTSMPQNIRAARMPRQEVEGLLAALPPGAGSVRPRPTRRGPRAALSLRPAGLAFQPSSDSLEKFEETF